MKSVVFVAFLVCVLLPAGAFAAGAHDSLSCTGCHSLHAAKGKLIFAVAPNKADVNPRTKKPFQDSTALCLGCHDETDKGGMGIKPISAHSSHPFGLDSINPKVARVPAELLRNGRFECIACHDPHPSNPNYKYLRVDTAGGSKMEKFCAVCHPMKADAGAVSGKISLFSSMDETGSRVLSPVTVSPETKASSAHKKQTSSRKAR